MPHLARLRALLAALGAGLLVLAGCPSQSGQKDETPAITAPFTDDFSRTELGPNWHVTGSANYRLVNGTLRIEKAYNHPAWLKRKLPRDVVVEFDVTSYSPAGDIKVEVFGDGKSFAQHKGAYTASGYVCIFGGWNNSISVLARMDEHGADRKERRLPKVVPGQKYHWKIVRKGTKISWSIDGTPFLEYDDPAPLEGPGHEYFGINDWESDLAFANLKIAPAP
jgi:hypothetical protein